MRQSWQLRKRPIAAVVQERAGSSHLTRPARKIACRVNDANRKLSVKRLFVAYPSPRRGAYDDVALEMPVTDSNFKERRSQQRIRFEAPASVSTGKYSIAASTKDISERGLFLFTNIRFERGSEIDIVIT